LGITPGNWRWLPPTVITQNSAYPARLLLCWKHGEKEPWLLATNLDHPPTILRLYARRMWIEMVCLQMTNSASFAIAA
jgi:hypothetical protein